MMMLTNGMLRRKRVIEKQSILKGRLELDRRRRDLVYDGF